MKNSTFLLLLVTSILILTTCKKDEENKQAPDISIFDVSKDTDWDYWVVGKEGDNLFVNVNNNKPTSVFYTPYPEQDGYSVFFDENGLPDKLVINDYIFVFSNFSGYYVDAALISPDGTINIARGVKTDTDWDEFFIKSASGEPSDWLRWTGHVLGAAACTAGYLAGPATFGVSWVVTGIGCGATAVSVITEFLPENYEIFGLTASTIGPIATAVGCVNDLGLSCALGTASTAFALMARNEEIIEEANDDVQIAESALENGYGDVQITLIWSNIADLDLHVIDPNGEEIYFAHEYSASNGTLDVDDIDGYGPENIFWPENEAPDGTYEVLVHHYPWSELSYQSATGNSGYPTTSNYTVLVNAFGTIAKYTGSISYDQSIPIISFDQDGLKSASAKSLVSITKSLKTK